MFARKLIAIITLAAGLGGTATVATNLSTVIGSTSTAGAPSVCFRKAVCGPGKQQPGIQIDYVSSTPSTAGG